MAESSPFVNGEIDMVIASQKQHYIVTRANPRPDGAPVTIAELRELHTMYGPKEADDLKRA